MPGAWRFIVYDTPSGHYAWRLVAATDVAVAESKRRFDTIGEARRDAQAVAANAAWAETDVQLAAKRPIKARRRGALASIAARGRAEP